MNIPIQDKGIDGYYRAESWHKNVMAKPTGEFRAPKAGEYYLSR